MSAQDADSGPCILKKKHRRVLPRLESQRTPSNTEQRSSIPKAKIGHPPQIDTRNRSEYAPLRQCQLRHETRKVFCLACQKPASVARAVEKAARIPIALQGMTHAAHNGSLCAVCKQCTHSGGRGVFFLEQAGTHSPCW